MRFKWIERMVLKEKRSQKRGKKKLAEHCETAEEESTLVSIIGEVDKRW